MNAPGTGRLDPRRARLGLQSEAEPDGDAEPPEPTGDADEPPAPSGLDAEPDDGEPAGVDDQPPTWTTWDGDDLALPLPVWLRWRRRRPRPPGWRRPGRPPRPRPPAVDRLRRLTAGARRIGTLRNRRSGGRFPVYRGTLGRRSYRIVARPRGGRRNEIVLVRPTQDVALEQELLAMSHGARLRDDTLAVAPDGYRLHLPHAGVHRILSRLQPEQVRRLAGGALGADPAPAVAASVRRLMRRARRIGNFRSRRSGQRLPVYAVAGYRILVRPLSARQGEIVMVRPPSAAEQETGRSVRARVRWHGPFPIPTSGPPAAAPDALLDSSGIYIVERAGKPIYVGKADQFRKRLNTRRQVMRQMGVDLRRYRVRLGTVTTLGGRATDVNRLPRVEQALIRMLRTSGQAPGLTNLQSTRAFRVGRSGLDIRNLNRPAYLQRGVKRGAGTSFETPGAE